MGGDFCDAVWMQLVVELPSREEQLAFNRRRWKEVCADDQVAKWPGKVETNAHGNILIMSPASGNHSYFQRTLSRMLEDRLGGYALPECPVSTMDGVRVADVGWYSQERFARVKGQSVFETAPEICVEVLSPHNTRSEMEAKRRLYFEAGAEEYWICGLEGTLTFYHREEPAEAREYSRLCPDAPGQLD